MTVDQITTFLTGLGNVHAMMGSAAQGDPELAWGDWFYYVVDTHGESPKMPFATIIIKDYPGFDDASNLNRGSLFRLNMELGKQAFLQRFGFETNEFDSHKDRYDFTKQDIVFPHPVYATYGWASIICPTDNSEDETKNLLAAARQRALKRAG